MSNHSAGETRIFSEVPSLAFDEYPLENDLRPLFFKLVQNSLLGSLPSETEGTARQGCGNDSFEVFGFLAFGLYLLNLVMNMKRRKRSADQCSSDFDPSREPELVEGVLAFYSMFQGLLTAFYDGEGRQCCNNCE